MVKRLYIIIALVVIAALVAVYLFAPQAIPGGGGIPNPFTKTLFTVPADGGVFQLSSGYYTGWKLTVIKNITINSMSVSVWKQIGSASIGDYELSIRKNGAVVWSVVVDGAKTTNCGANAPPCPVSHSEAVTGASFVPGDVATFLVRGLTGSQFLGSSGSSPPATAEFYSAIHGSGGSSGDVPTNTDPSMEVKGTG
jgi:hypothetical protein